MENTMENTLVSGEHSFVQSEHPWVPKRRKKRGEHLGDPRSGPVGD